MSKLISKGEPNIIKKMGTIIRNIKNVTATGISMRLRLFLFLVVLVVTMVLGVFVMLLLTGVFSIGLTENKKLVHNELSHLVQGVTDQFGGLSVHTVDFSRGLSESIERNLSKQGLKVTDLPDHPEILEELIGNEYERMLFSLQKTKTSGVFMILDTTVNANLENAATSKAGLYIKNMEPNIISSSAPTILILRGFPNIARQNSLPLHSQWAMEFDVNNAPYYKLPMEQATYRKYPLSRLYYWSPAFILPGTSEEVMLCSIPLMDSNGKVFGVCGFEVSAMLFKLAQMPNNNTYDRIFCMLSPLQDDGLNISQALFSGRYREVKNVVADQTLHITESQKSFYSYRQGDNAAFAGFHEEIQLYPNGSPFADQRWAVAIMIPKQDIAVSISRLNLRLSLIGISLMAIGIIISFFLSRRYLRPITAGLAIIKSNKLKDAPITKIPEIDDLIQFLSLNSKKTLQSPETELSHSVFDEFVKNTKNLSPAERAVFDLYVQGHTAKEITQILCLSINTIKTHNKRIYMKLNVTSRDDLLGYVRMLEVTKG